MAQTFFFYDLETSGLNPRQDRIMQFAGQRTDMNLEPIGEPYNLLVTLNDDTLPSPDALMVTGITPQKTVEEGYTEAQFARILSEESFTPETSKGEPSNRLELITSANSIAHENAHDALADVTALIAVTKLIKQKQPQLYDYLLKMRDKKVVQQLVNVDDKKPFVYASGRYDKEFAKTTVAFPMTTSRNGGVVVYDLRYDPTPFVGLSAEELAKKIFASWEERQAEDFVKLPVKELQYNRCPAVAPLGVLEQGDGWQKISLDLETVQKHQDILLKYSDFAEKLRTIFENKPAFKKLPDPEAQLYDGFLNDGDRLRVEAVRNADERELADFHPEFQDERLAPLLLHYKARNFPRSLSEDDLVQWEAWRAQHLQAQLPQFMASLQRLAPTAIDEQQFILEELQLWVDSVLPVVDS